MASRVTVHGPLWDGEASRAVTEWLDATRKDVGDQAASIVRSKAARMNRSGRGGTGGAAQSVSVLHESTGTLVRGQSERGKVWWPWLEGTSHRNTTTRFRGYHAFRLAKNIAARQARKTAQDKLNEFIGRMGGHAG